VDEHQRRHQFQHPDDHHEAGGPALVAEAEDPGAAMISTAIKGSKRHAG